MAATDHTRLRTAQPSVDSKSTDISRNFPPGVDAPSGAAPACDAACAPAIPTDASGVRARIRRQTGKVCDYLELGSSLATVASRTASASIYADDQSLANHLADLAELIEEQVANLRNAAGIDLTPAAARPGTLNLPLETVGTVSQRAAGGAMPPESPT